jgi:hypothetical protein
MSHELDTLQQEQPERLQHGQGTAPEQPLRMEDRGVARRATYQLMHDMNRYVVGLPHVVRRVVMGLLADGQVKPGKAVCGHILLEAPYRVPPRLCCQKPSPHYYKCHIAVCKWTRTNDLGDLLFKDAPELSQAERERFRQFFFALPVEARDPWPIERRGSAGSGGGRAGH